MYAQQVDEEWQTIKGGPDTISQAFVDQIAGRFVWPQYDPAARDEPDHSAELAAADKRYARWLRTNVHAHKVPGYAAVTVSLKATGVPPGDITADQMDAVAALADEHGFGELRVSHEQNLILADVRRARLHELWRQLEALNLATPTWVCSPTSSPVPAGTSARWPMPSPSRWPKPSSASSTTWTICSRSASWT